MEPDLDALSALYPQLSAQLRLALQDLQVAAARLAPARDRERDPELDRQAAALDRSCYRLLRLCTDLTATAWLSRDRDFRPKNLDLAALVQEVFASAQSLAELKGLHLRLLCPEDSHPIAGDRAGLEQLLYQLLSNAFKFTPAGGTVTLELKKVRDTVQLTVTDTGCGIPADRLETLFSRCLAPEDLPSLPDQGLGLGLALCRAIAQAHGGTLVADSREGCGSRFTVSLPDRTLDLPGLSDVGFDYAGGFNPALVHLADALPVEAFLLRNQ